MLTGKAAAPMPSPPSLTGSLGIPWATSPAPGIEAKSRQGQGHRRVQVSRGGWLAQTSIRTAHRLTPGTHSRGGGPGTWVHHSQASAFSYPRSLPHLRCP